MFTGSYGIGKTSLARILAKCINCKEGITIDPCLKCVNCINIAYSNSVDVIEIDAASKSKIEDIRDLIQHVKYRPLISKYKIFIIDEIHMLSIYSFNALLKILEEPPNYVVFILATTNKDKIPKTILSRCLKFKLRKLHIKEIINQLTYILKIEKIEFEYHALQNISYFSNGSMRDALGILEQCIGINGNNITYPETNKILGLAGYNIVIYLLLSIIKKDTIKTLKIIRKINKYTDLKKVLNEIIIVLYQLNIVININNIEELNNFIYDSGFIFYYKKLYQLSKLIKSKDIQLYYEIVSFGIKKLDYAPTIQIGFEMIIFRMISYEPQNFKNELSESSLI